MTHGTSPFHGDTGSTKRASISGSPAIPSNPSSSKHHKNSLCTCCGCYLAQRTTKTAAAYTATRRVYPSSHHPRTTRPSSRLPHPSSRKKLVRLRSRPFPFHRCQGKGNKPLLPPYLKGHKQALGLLQGHQQNKNSHNQILLLRSSSSSSSSNHYQLGPSSPLSCSASAS